VYRTTQGMGKSWSQMFAGSDSEEYYLCRP
jgi:hypothetical protein